MNKKVLIIGTGNQGKKYYNFFKNKGFKITLINKSGLDRDNYFTESIKRVDNIKFSFFPFDKFDYIIVAIYPIYEQTNILNVLYNNVNTSKVIVEKPVTFKVDFLEKLVNNKCFFFFIDEAYDYLLNNFSFDVNKLFFVLPKDIDLLQHSLGWFLRIDSFESLLTKNRFIFLKEKKYNYLYYKVIEKSENQLINIKGNIILYSNKRRYYSMQFSDYVGNIIALNEDVNKKIKKNFLKLTKFIMNCGLK